MRPPSLQALFSNRSLVTQDEFGRSIEWSGSRVYGGVRLPAPLRGTVRYEILRGKGDDSHGFDIEPDGGAVVLDTGERLPALRTWDDRRYEERGEYRFEAPGQRVWVWNVYRTPLPSGQTREEKWTGNAGMLLSVESPGMFVLGCSPGFAPEPDFEHLVVRIALEAVGSPEVGL